MIGVLAMRAKFTFATLALAGFATATLLFAGRGESADRTPLGSPLLLAQAGPTPGAPGNVPPPLPSAAAVDDDDDQAPAGGEIQTRGPVHEAFARPVEENPGPGP